MRSLLRGSSGCRLRNDHHVCFFIRVAIVTRRRTVTSTCCGRYFFDNKGSQLTNTFQYNTALVKGRGLTRLLFFGSPCRQRRRCLIVALVVATTTATTTSWQGLVGSHHAYNAVFSRHRLVFGERNVSYFATYCQEASFVPTRRCGETDVNRRVGRSLWRTRVGFALERIDLYFEEHPAWFIFG